MKHTALVSASTAVRYENRNESGSIIMPAATVILVLFAFMGLALDASYMNYYRRRMQTAADAAALAGSHQILRVQSTESVIASARAMTRSWKSSSVSSVPPGSCVSWA